MNDYVIPNVTKLTAKQTKNIIYVGIIETWI